MDRAKWVTLSEEERGRALRLIVNGRRACAEVAAMQRGAAYYGGENTEIMKRKKQFYTEQGLVDDPYKANVKIPSGFFGLLVNQKVQYLLGNGVRIAPVAPPAPIAPGAAAPALPDVAPLKKVLGRKFEKRVQEAAKEASKKRVGWAYIYIDNKGDFAIKASIPSEQLLPVWSQDGETLEMMIRMFDTTDEDGGIETTVEVYDSEQVATYTGSGTSGDPFRLKIDPAVYNPKRYIRRQVKYGDKVAEESFSSWGGLVPWVPLWNNDDRTSDLTKAVKEEIDAFDVVTSDFANNLIDVQDIYWIVKNYGGEDLSRFLSDLKKYRSIKVGDEGEVKAEKIEIPTEAREKLLGILNDAIFRDGRGVDPGKVGDGNITNVVIRSRYAGLDLKCDEFEWHVADFVSNVVAFAFLYMREKKLTPADFDFEVNFVRRMIINEVELLKANTEQQGSISEETRLANHPWVTDPAAEIERMGASGPITLNGDDGNEDGEGADIDGEPGAEGDPAPAGAAGL